MADRDSTSGFAGWSVRRARRQELRRLPIAVGILPATAVYTLFADALLRGSQEASPEAVLRVLVAGVLLALLALLPTSPEKMNRSIPGTTIFVLGLLGQWGAPLAAQTLPDHSELDAILEGVVEQPLVDYQELTRQRDELDAYVERLGRTDPGELERATREERLAFWINAYNACMLKLVADHYPLDSADAGIIGAVRNFFAGYPSNSVWQIRNVFSREHCPVAGEERSQDEIEHEIIRPGFEEPRIHFAVNCAAISCPVLWPEAYHPDELDEQLDRAVEHFIRTDEHFRLEARPSPTLRLNKVLDWYRDDFGGVEGLKEFFAGYLSGDRRELVLQPETEVAFFEYDWTLNDVPR